MNKLNAHYSRVLGGEASESIDGLFNYEEIIFELFFFKLGFYCPYFIRQK
tara:strand:+ start:550 stop:699 length:150 start_codon:yes stop_codon:yes gene_type:complete